MTKVFSIEQRRAVAEKLKDLPYVEVASPRPWHNNPAPDGFHGVVVYVENLDDLPEEHRIPDCVDGVPIRTKEIPEAEFARENV